LFCAKLVIVSTKQKSEIRTVFIFYSFIVNVVFSADAQRFIYVTTNLKTFVNGMRLNW
jgi:hypothetical protein